MNELEQKIINIIKNEPGQKAKDIAKQLGIERKLINSVLYNRLKGKIKQDKDYRWYPNDAVEFEEKKQGPIKSDNILGRLSRYYLDCLSRDDLGGVSEFAASIYDDPNYYELEKLPMFDEEGGGGDVVGVGGFFDTVARVDDSVVNIPNAH